MTVDRLRLRPTRDGLVLLGLGGCLLAVALLTGNNLLYVLVAVLCALEGVDGVLARWNLRGLEVARELPAELFAGGEGRGRLLVRNRRRALGARSVQVVDADGGAEAELAVVGPGAERAAPAGWRFATRGPVRLGHVTLSSTFPFGLWVASRQIGLPAEVVVYPAPRPAPVTRESGEAGHVGESSRLQGGLGDMTGLRAYQPGDRLRAIHWPTSARVGAPIVVVRAPEAAERVVVRVRDREGEGWEREISRATGQLLRAFAEDAEVGLELADVRYGARSGAGWRRALLEALARAPRREVRP